MSERGYLWEDLSGEVAEEFSTFGAVASREEVRAAGLALVCAREVNPEAVVDQTHTDRNNRAYYRAAVRGQCVKCSEPARPNLKTCQSCCDKATQRQKIRRKVMRERMPELRGGVTHHFVIVARCAKLKCIAGKVGDRDCSRCGGTGTREVDGYITCNVYPDDYADPARRGQLGEIFIRVGKSGAEEAIYEQWAIGASIAIQFGVPVRDYFRKFLATQFEPAGATRNPDIKRCTSVLDYVAKYVIARYAAPESELDATESAAQAGVQP